MKRPASNAALISKALNFTSRRLWREWLGRNHSKAIEALLVIYKRPPKNLALSNADALEEALSFGWIDGWFKPVDSERWVIRYTPRRKGSSWSDYNIARAWILLNKGTMTSAGIARLPPDVIAVWKECHPLPTIIDPQGARKGEIMFAGTEENYLSRVRRPALSP